MADRVADSAEAPERPGPPPPGLGIPETSGGSGGNTCKRPPPPTPGLGRAETYGSRRRSLRQWWADRSHKAKIESLAAEVADLRIQVENQGRWWRNEARPSQGYVRY